MYASRNIDLCSKDCLCLFVCPTGATDTETGQIDSTRCLDGCRLCVDACPSGAIYLVYHNYPAPGAKDPALVEAMLALLAKKADQEALAETLEGAGSSPGEKKLARALKLSCRIVGEDCAREAGYMLPQSREVRGLLESLQDHSDPEVKKTVERLLELL
jgi:NAD-dependent dihydropyrimidine dehydrogenase PreA subunit